MSARSDPLTLGHLPPQGTCAAMLTAASDLLQLILPDQAAAKPVAPGKSGAEFSHLMRGESALSLGAESNADDAAQLDRPAERQRPVDRSDDRRSARADEKRRADSAERAADAAEASAADSASTPEDTSLGKEPLEEPASDEGVDQEATSATDEGSTADNDAQDSPSAQEEPRSTEAPSEDQRPQTGAADPDLPGLAPNPAVAAQNAAIQGTDATTPLADTAAAVEAARAAGASSASAGQAQAAQPALRADRPTEAPLPGQPSAASGVSAPAGATGSGSAGADGDAGQSGQQRPGAGQTIQANFAAAAQSQAAQTGASASGGPLSVAGLEAASGRDRILFDPAGWGRPASPSAAGHSMDASSLSAAPGAGTTGRLLSGTATIATTRAAQQPPTARMATDQVAVRMTKAAGEDTDRFTLQLKPAMLGKIEVQMEIAEGRLTAIVTVDKPETLTMLQRDARGLEQALADAGFDAGDGGLEFNLSDTGQQSLAEDQAGSGAPSGTSLTDPLSAGEEVDLDLALLASDDTGVWTPATGLDIQA